MDPLRGLAGQSGDEQEFFEARLADPLHIAVRFYSAEHGGIIGAGLGAPHIVARENMESAAEVMSLCGSGKTSDRGLVAWPDGSGMWLDASDLVPA